MLLEILYNIITKQFGRWIFCIILLIAAPAVCWNGPPQFGRSFIIIHSETENKMQSTEIAKLKFVKSFMQTHWTFFKKLVISMQNELELKCGQFAINLKNSLYWVSLKGFPVENNLSFKSPIQFHAATSNFSLFVVGWLSTSKNSEKRV